jgi:hypothetical protein
MNLMPNLYLVTRNENDHIGYDEYDSCVVCATSPEEAITIHPSFEKGNPDKVSYVYVDEQWYMIFNDGSVDTESAYNGAGWTSDIESLQVENIGQAQGAYMLGRVICSSFCAG